MFGIDELIKGMWWDIGKGTTFPLADLLGNLMKYFSVLSAKLTGSDVLSSAEGSWRGEITEYAMWIAIAIFTIVIGISLATGNFNNTKKFLRNMLVIASIGTFLYIPVNVVGGMLNHAIPCVSNDSTVADSCQSTIGDNFTINLLRPYVYRVNADGKKIDSNGNPQGSNEYDESKVYNVLSSADTDTNTLYFGDVNNNAKFTFEDKDIKDLKRGNNYVFDPTLKGKIEGSNMEFTYDYNSIVVLLFGNIALLVIFIISIVKLILRLLNLVAIMFYSPFTLTYATFQGSQAYKALFTTMMTNLFAILLQILYFMFMVSLIGIVTSASTGFGPIFALIGLITVGIFMFDGPDELKKIFGDIDLGTNGAAQAYVAGKVGQQLGKAGANAVGATAGVLGINEASKSIAGGMRNSHIGQAHQGMKDNINEAMFGAGGLAGAGASQTGSNYQEWKEQQQQRKNGGWSKNQGKDEENKNGKTKQAPGEGKEKGGSSDLGSNNFTANEGTNNPNQTVDLDDIETTEASTDQTSGGTNGESNTTSTNGTPGTTEKTANGENITQLGNNESSSKTNPSVGPKVNSNGKEFNAIATENGILGKNTATGETMEMKEDIKNPGNYQVSANGETIGTADTSGNITTLNGEDGGHINDYGIEFAQSTNSQANNPSNASSQGGVNTSYNPQSNQVSDSSIASSNPSPYSSVGATTTNYKPTNKSTNSTSTKAPSNITNNTSGGSNQRNVSSNNFETGDQLFTNPANSVILDDVSVTEQKIDLTTTNSSNDIIEPVDNSSGIIKD